MPSSPNARFLCSASLPSFRVLAPLVLILLLLSTLTDAQTPRPAAKKTSPQRANELTLAGLRPGRDTVARAAELNRNMLAAPKDSLQDGQMEWADKCRRSTLAIDADPMKKVQVIRVTHAEFVNDCVKLPPSSWKTGLGLRVNDPASRVAQLYGEPDSRSPSSKGGQQLELWYYAFDWAGADVPQVMEVLCTKEKNGKPGQVIEITLAAPSL
jgi:hypothetical protein